MVATPLFELEGLTVTPEGNSTKPVINGVSFSLSAGQRLGLIGRSGCGKSVTSHAIMDILRPPLHRTDGKAFLMGTEIFSLTGPERQKIRGTGIFCIFQSPGSALHPALTIEQQMRELPPLAMEDTSIRDDLIGEAFSILALPQRALKQYPGQLSGGMKQRVLMAMALILKPQLLIADEPTTGLDVLTERDVLQAMEVTLQETQSACLFISHDVRIVKRVCPSLLVMEEGRIVDHCTVQELAAPNRAPATQEIIQALEAL